MPPRKLSGRRATRAATSAEKFAIEPPDVRMPCAVSGSPKTSASHRITDASSATSAGAVAARFTNRLVTQARKSAMADAYSPPPGMNAR